MNLPEMGRGMRFEGRLLGYFLVLTLAFDIGRPFDSLHLEDHTCPGRRDPGCSLTNCILGSL